MKAPTNMLILLTLFVSPAMAQDSARSQTKTNAAKADVYVAGKPIMDTQLINNTKDTVVVKSTTKKKYIRKKKHCSKTRKSSGQVSR